MDGADVVVGPRRVELHDVALAGREQAGGRAFLQGNGIVLSGPTQLYYAQLVGTTAAQAARLYDNAGAPQNQIANLVAPAFESGSPFPPRERATVSLQRGLYVSFSSTWFTGGLQVGFEKQ